MGPDREFRIKKSRYLNVAVLTLLLTLPPLLAMGGSVPKANCGPNDRVETGLQGQTTLAERESGDSELGYNCNLELVGQFQGEGAKWQMAWFDDCAYYGTVNRPEVQQRGVVVVDASDPRNPQPTAYLDDTPAMLDPHESLKVNKKRQLLAGVQNNGPGFAIYDVSDCRHPVLKASIEMPGSTGSIGHAGDFAPDGLTYYAGSDPGAPGGQHLYAIDVTDPSNPTYILRYPLPPGGIGAPHDLSISKDGTRAYIANRFLGNNFTQGHNGLVILDVSDIQFRRPNPQVREISTLFWPDGSTAQQTLPVTYRGRPHLIFTDEQGSGGGGAAGKAAACAAGLPTFGFARIIDISDETNPKIVSKLMLEVHDPANCPSVLDDPTVGIGYSSHYCGVDKTENPKLLACTYPEAGLRVFDIRDPVHPKEIAYYKPPARRTAFLPGSAFWAADRDRTTDRTATQVRFRKHKGETHLWFTSQDNGFQIVRFTNRLMALTGLEFDQDHPGNRN